MSPILALWLPALVGTWSLTALVRRYAIARAVVDVPNARSSHSVPTPRGGGLAIAAVVLPCVAGLGAAGALDRRLALALVGGGALIAGIGWIDDRRGVGARARFVVHLTAALWAVALLGGLPALDLGPVSLSLGPAGPLLAVLGVVWLINLYNFMDGIDGLAAGEAVSAGLAGAALLLLVDSAGLALVALLIAATSAGFLVWNWAPAKIFMGDVGSGLLGYLFAVLALASERSGAVPLLGWAILLSVFLFDATATLLRRMLRGERWYAAHRSHAYQRAVRGGYTHAQVSGAILGLNLLLASLAAAGVVWPRSLPLALAGSLLLLSVLYRRIERLQSM